tara:strand:- start:694 stop:879 length:186 start_codon:yes stop_codon:yes gene_type:complete
MDKQSLEQIISLRSDLINKFEKLRDYKMNPNAIMKETDHARLISDTINRIDKILKEHVSFK